MEMVYEKIKLFRKQMEILIPEGFKDMPDYVAKRNIHQSTDHRSY